MYSSEDFERFYYQYQPEALPSGLSMQSFCSQNKVPYNLLLKWYKDTRRQIIEVKVDGRPSEIESMAMVPVQYPVVSQPSSSSTLICVDIHLSNGLHLSQENLSYPELLGMIEKLEVLC